MRVKACAIAKDEGAYLAQWVHHHLWFGFDAVEVWLNRLTDNSQQMMEELRRLDSRVDYAVVDPEEVIGHRASTFQEAAYRKLFQKARSEGFDYVLFLDLDEYWTPRNFADSIHDVVHAIPQAGAISFQWYLDNPDSSKAPFDRAYKSTTWLSQNRHVKTLAKVTDKVDRFKIHNVILDGDDYFLADGSHFEEEDVKGQIGRQLVGESYFRAAKGEIQPYFILHFVNRSELEYAASLLRGRPNRPNRTSVPIKDNRWGYFREPSSHPAVDFSIDPDALAEYYLSLDRYLGQGRITELLVEARGYLVEKFRTITKLLQEEPEELRTVQHVFRGLTFPAATDFLHAQGPLVTAHVDSASGENGLLIVTGWAFASDYSEDHTFLLTDDEQQLLPASVEYLQRPDVLEAVDQSAPLACGFKATFTIDQAQLIAPKLHIQGGCGPVKEIPLPLSHSQR